MYRVKDRTGSVFGTEPCVCDFVCDTPDDINTLPTSLVEGTGGKTEYDNQKCASGSAAFIFQSGKPISIYILNNQDIWVNVSDTSTNNDNEEINQVIDTLVEV